MLHAPLFRLSKPPLCASPRAPALMNSPSASAKRPLSSRNMACARCTAGMRSRAAACGKEAGGRVSRASNQLPRQQRRRKGICGLPVKRAVLHSTRAAHLGEGKGVAKGARLQGGVHRSVAQPKAAQQGARLLGRHRHSPAVRDLVRARGKQAS